MGLEPTTFCMASRRSSQLSYIRAGREERVAELRLETVYSADRESEVVAALRAAHPYEEPAFDLYELLDPPA